MRHRLAFLAAASTLLAAACSSPTPPPAPAAQAAVTEDDGEPPNPVAKLAVLAHPPSLTPGARTWIGARLVVAPGWHVYAEDAGEAGLPTRVTVDAPAGLVVGRTIYAPAKRIVEPGDIALNVYEGETMLLVPVDVPADFASEGSVTLKVHASWLACKAQCIKESADAELLLPVGPAAVTPPESVALFTRYLPATHPPETPQP